MSAVPTVHVPVKVHVVRPKMTWSDFATKLVGGILASLVVAWVLMLLAQELVPEWDATYWDALMTLAAARLLQLNPNSTRWTHKPEGSAL